METGEYTVKDIATSLAKSDDPDEIKRIGRQIWHWTNVGILTPTGQVHVGSGRARKYTILEVYKAAIAAELVKRGLSVGQILGALEWTDVYRFHDFEEKKVDIYDKDFWDNKRVEICVYNYIGRNDGEEHSTVSIGIDSDYSFPTINGFPRSYIVIALSLLLQDLNI